MKTSKELLKKQIDSIKNLTGLNQTEISVKAGYKPNTLTQALAKEEGHEAVLHQLKLPVLYRSILRKKFCSFDKIKMQGLKLLHCVTKKNYLFKLR